MKTKYPSRHCTYGWLLLAAAMGWGSVQLPSAVGQDNTPAVEESAEQETPAPEASGQPESQEPTSDDPSADPPATEEPAAEQPALEQPAGDEPMDDADAIGEETPPADEAETPTLDEPPPADDQPPTAEEEATDDAEEDAEAAGTPATPAGPSAGESAAGEVRGMSPYLLAVIIAALFILPALLGSFLGRKFGMPDHGWKIAVATGTIAAAALAIYFAFAFGDGFKLGPDLGGGVTLIYDLADPDQVRDPDAPPPEDDAAGRRAFSMDKLIGALKERIDPTGTKEITIRTRGKSIEFIIPKAGQAELDFIKRKITALGELEFRILVDRRRTSEYEDIIRIAENLPPGQTLVRIGGQPRAKWVPYKIEEFGPLDAAPPPGDDRAQGIVKRMGVNEPEVLVELDPYNVTGDYLTGARKGVGPEGYEVRFNFDSRGANRFGKLTGRHTPNPNPYYLAIILDDRVLSAPSIRSRITDSGSISGRGMDEAEVDYVVSVLEAGSLPAALNKVPISEDQTGPEIGETTIRQGQRAITISMAMVLVFMLIYYRFAGVVACLALVTNILLVLGAMVLLSAAFTLPGLAGLVLIVGMSVDANVLIFERIREELSRGATLRMAIRNGFGRATTTIVDANVTTLITGVVLYVIGTDQIKGFAVTLILGILMSMYTAIFCARILFDIAERKNWITRLHMMQMLSRADFRWTSMWPAATVLSAVLIVAGLLGVAARQENMLNIDFTGGTSVTMVLKEEDAMPIGEVRQTLLETPLRDRNLLVVERSQTDVANTTYKIDTNVLDGDLPEVTAGEDVSAVKIVEAILADAFADKLETHEISVQSIEPFAEGEDDENAYRGIEATLRFGGADADESIVGVTRDAILEEVNSALSQLGREGIRPTATNPRYTPGSSQRFREWTIRLGGMEESEARQVIDQIVDNYGGQPIFPLANKIGGRVAGEMQMQAIYAVVVSLLGIIGYIWVRFQKISYGLAAVAALVHDVLITLSALALSAYVVAYAPPLATALQLEAFQISLPIVAAFLTIIGYSLNDTIVIFDRIREVRGKSPTLSAEMINTSVNQTLSRTLLTSITTLIVVVTLYFFGGDGIHAFAFALVVGVIAGTYSTVFIASPVLLWLSRLQDEWSR